MNIEGDDTRNVRIATTASGHVSTSHGQCEAKYIEVDRLQAHLDKTRAEEEEKENDNDNDDALLLPHAQAVNNTDPLSFLCCCKFKRLGQSYILHERRDGVTMKTKLVIIGPHWIGVLITLSIILISTGVILSQHMAKMPWYNIMMTLGLCSMTLFYLFQTTCSDPGIVQSKTEKNMLLTEDESEVATLQAGNVITRKKAVEMQTVSADYELRRRPQRYRFCDICGIKQDRSTDHCDDCGVCVAGYDHHCPWMGKCIGQGNIHAFKMFNVSWVSYAVFVLFISINWGQVSV
ncbi:unnamed protein product [Peronospora belbahrii]|uniref:Palmitoyltransferase n=1 Tax=Peronospora belbahrii TaxID=622444 RepID=A0AAU9L4E3_9STRA|nr:unnamed protein product [Peronospora belbahrii]CAH0519215.1 unnamed protein product [Peronospora belbahrii]